MQISLHMFNIQAYLKLKEQPSLFEDASVNSDNCASLAKVVAELIHLRFKPDWLHFYFLDSFGVRPI